MITTDFKLGNWFQHKSSKKITRVTGFFQSAGQWNIDTEHHGLNLMENYESIVLTEKWLTDFGIEKLSVSGYVISDAIYWRKGKITFYQIGDKFTVPIGESFSNDFGRTILEFNTVHELQDLYRLAGIELIRA